MARPYALREITLKLGSKEFQCWVKSYRLEADTPTTEWQTLCPSGTGTVAGVTTFNLTVSGYNEHDGGQKSLSWFLLNNDGDKETFEIVDNGIKISGEVTIVPPQLGGTVGELSEFDLTFPLSGKPTISADPLSAPKNKSAVLPGDVFPVDAAVTTVANLAAAGYKAASTEAWAAGEKFKVGTVEAKWSGTAWAAPTKADDAAA